MRHSTANCAMRRMFGGAPAADAPMSSTTSSSASFSLKMRTALTGSPTYFSSPKRTVLTSPPSRSSRQGVIRGRSMSETGEVAEQARPVLMAFFRMELDAEDVGRVHGAGEIAAVVRYGERVGRALALEVERVQEVKARVAV